ncbi:MAG: hypothetical protein ABR599_11945 [Gemmatimonadota bacterium]
MASPSSRSGGRTALTAVVLLALATPPVPAQEPPGASRSRARLEVGADTTRVTVGQVVTLEVRARLAPGDVPLARAVAPAEPLPGGVRILAADSLAPGPGGELRGRVRLAFFRPGSTEVPALALAFTPAAGGGERRLRSAPVPVTVVSVLPPGEQELRDIKDLVPLDARAPWWPWLLAAVLAAAAALAFWAWRRRRRRTPRAAAAAPTGARPTPYEAALERLAAIERQGWAARGEVAPHYAETADVLRRYLEEAEAVPALERTTSELVWALPPRLTADGARDECRALFEDADLVKFARLRPDAGAAAGFSADARRLLGAWHAAGLRAREAERMAAAAASAEAQPGTPFAGAAESPGAWAPPPEAGDAALR